MCIFCGVFSFFALIMVGFVFALHILWLLFLALARRTIEMLSAPFPLVSCNACMQYLTLMWTPQDEAPVVTFECTVCYEDEPVDGSWSLDCQHRFCTTCMYEALRVKIESNKVTSDELTCPNEGCGLEVHHALVKGVTDAMAVLNAENGVMVTLLPLFCWKEPISLHFLHHSTNPSRADPLCDLFFLI